MSAFMLPKSLITVLLFIDLMRRAARHVPPFFLSDKKEESGEAPKPTALGSLLATPFDRPPGRKQADL